MTGCSQRSSVQAPSSSSTDVMNPNESWHCAPSKSRAIWKGCRQAQHPEVQNQRSTPFSLSTTSIGLHNKASSQRGRTRTSYQCSTKIMTAMHGRNIGHCCPFVYAELPQENYRRLQCSNHFVVCMAGCQGDWQAAGSVLKTYMLES